ncbi:hypothetical protein [Halomontanus rarus]|uniref:hypothetical protein n=1 Tax=Halomontanus rarus TaxID=3034020 RepID=UPI001F61E541|nr:hypothetical protein [Halovivax sp. TS33]
MATTQRESDGGPGLFVTAFDAFRSSPSNIILAMGVVLFVIGALVLRVGVLAAILGVWGCALILLAVSIRTAVWWIRR